MTVRLDAEAYAWLTTVSEDLGAELAVSTVARLAIQWAHWIQLDLENREKAKWIAQHGFSAYVRDETGASA